MIKKTNQNIETAAELSLMPDDGNRYELVQGTLKIMSPAGSEHGEVADRIGRRLGDFVETHNLGKTFAAETGFRIENDPDTVRAPDAAFVSHDRLASVESTHVYLPLAPDLVVEVVSPNDSFSDVEAKAEQWMNAGTKIVLIADPANRTLGVYESVSHMRVLHSGEIFESGNVCGRWQLSVDDAFQIEK